MMRIGIDGSATLKQPTGIGRYSERLIESLARNAPEVEFVVVTISYKDAPPSYWLRKLSNVSVVHKRWPGRAVLWSWEHFRWPKAETAVGRVDIFHSPNNNVFPLRKGKAVVTIHDLFFLEHPHETHTTGGQYHYRVLPRTIGEVDHVITVSQTAAEAVKRAFLVPDERVSVVYQGVDERFFAEVPPDERAKALGQLGIDKPYVLHFGTIEPRKGLDTLLSAMELLWARRGFGGALVLAGLRGWASDRLLSRCDELGRLWPLLLTGYVSEESVPAVLNGARLAVFPSRYEGFGLAGLEAMAAGVPVISTARGALPEIYEQAAIYFECGNAEELAEQISFVWQDEELRRSLIERGKHRARLFTWDKTAQQTLAIYKRLCPWRE